MKESKDFVSSSSFKLKNENNDMFSVNAHSNTFRLSIKEIQSTLNDKDKN